MRGVVYGLLASLPAWVSLALLLLWALGVIR